MDKEAKTKAKKLVMKKGNHDYKKRFFEYYAKTILEAIDSASFHDIRMQDRPDLLNNNGVGIEVTRVMFSSDGEASSIFHRISGKTKEEADQRTLKRFEQLGIELSYLREKIIGYYPKAQWCTLKELQDAFKNKLKKNESYAVNTDLFIFAPGSEWYELNMIKDFTIWAMEEQGKAAKKFSQVFVFQYDDIFVCDLVTGNVDSFPFNRETLQKCYEDSLVYAKRGVVICQTSDF